ncbi:MAG: hypothetical protein ACK4SO_08360, partial [Candidatus Kapaibacteriota bacterium]
MLIAAGGFTPIGYNKLSYPNCKKIWRHLRSIAKEMFENLGPFSNAGAEIIAYYYDFSVPMDYASSIFLASGNGNKSPPLVPSSETPLGSRLVTLLRKAFHFELIPAFLLSLLLLVVPQQSV